MARHILRRNQGQSLLTIALFLVGLFTLTGFAIDGGLLYMQRRLMQNTADAACLAAANRIALGQDTTAARTAAQAVINTNLGATPGTSINAPGTLNYTSVDQVYNGTSLVGSGTSLSHGIEINGADVRVALASPAYTFFMRIIGITNYTAAARAHCNAIAGGGAMPIAIARYRGYINTTTTDADGGTLTTDKTLPQTRNPGNTTLVVRDVLQARSTNDGKITQWPGWGTSGYPGNPSSNNYCCLYSQSLAPASTSNPGFPIVLAGSGARPNTGDNSFTGPVVLDLRNILTSQPLFYNGLNPATNPNVYKDFATRYILGQYPGPDVQPGQQLAYYSGVSAGQIQKPFDLRYNVGDIVTVLVYNGTIYNDPNFTVDAPSPTVASDTTQSRTVNLPFSGNYPSDCKLSSYAGSYLFDGTKLSPSISGMKPLGPFRVSVVPANSSVFKMRTFLSTDPASWGKLQGRWLDNSGTALSGWKDFNINSQGIETGIDSSGRTLQFQIAQSETGTCTTTDPFSPTLTIDTTLPVRPKVGAQTLYIESQDLGTTKRRARYAFINVSANSNDFYAYFPGKIEYQPFEPGATTQKFDFSLQSVNSSTPNLTIQNLTSPPSFTWFDPNLAPVSAPADIAIALAKQGNNNNQLSVTVGNNAATGKEYYLRITLTKGSYQHYAWFFIQVRPALNNSSGIKQFVYALGYAQFKITDISANSLSGVAISGLLKPSEVKAGMLPRLIPWDQ